jgi:hypothetical protein
MGQLQLQFSGQLVAGPAMVSDSFFPSGTSTIQLSTAPSPKQYAVDTGPQRPLVNSPSSFQTLSGIGAGQTVTMASFLYFKSLTPVQLRLTYSGDATPKVRYTNGNVIEEFDPAHPLTLLEIMGSGQVEYWACGLQ